MPKKKGGGKRKGPPETPEEKAMRLEMERLKGIEDEIHRAGIMRHNLDTNLKNEAENSKLNMAKIQHTWRKIMRDSNVSEMISHAQSREFLVNTIKVRGEGFKKFGKYQ